MTANAILLGLALSVVSCAKATSSQDTKEPTPEKMVSDYAREKIQRDNDYRYNEPVPVKDDLLSPIDLQIFTVQGNLDVSDVQGPPEIIYHILAFNRKEGKVFEIAKWSDLKAYLKKVTCSAEAKQVAELLAKFIPAQACPCIRRFGSMPLSELKVEANGKGWTAQGKVQDPETKEKYEMRIDFDDQGQVVDVGHKVPAGHGHQ